MNFCSDNVAGAAPEVMAALVAANQGLAPAFGADGLTERVERRFADAFETDVHVFPVTTRTAANALALSVMTPPFGAILCHANAHVVTMECGASVFYSGGAKLVPLPGENGRIAPETLAGVLDASLKPADDNPPAALTLTQASEAGTVYGLDHVRALADVAHAHGLKVHMDGARFAGAVASLGCTPAELTWRSGVDALSFGATKNGTLAADAVVLFDAALAGTFLYRAKRGGHRVSKSRFLAAQLDAYLADDLWLENARHANAMAGRLADGLARIPGVAIIHPVEANEVFATLPDAVIDGLLDDGFLFFRRSTPDGPGIRLVTSFATRAEHVDAFIGAARSRAGVAAAE